MKFDDEIIYLKGVGPETAKKLAQLGIVSLQDLIMHWPRRYDDYSDVVKISDVRPGKRTIKAKLSRVKGRYIRRGMHVTEAYATDDSGSLHITWFNQPYRAAAIKGDAEYLISGDFAMHSGRLNMSNPALELAGDLKANGSLISPIYPETKGLTSKQISRMMKSVAPLIAQLSETLPSWLVAQEGLVSYSEALTYLHLPKNSQEIALARQRLSFEELFELQLSAALNRQLLANDFAPAINFDEPAAKHFTASLPFQLTPDQKKVAWQIIKDMDSSSPMNRLVEGDVGSGKTVVSALAALMTMLSGFQVLYMAPTEILARQHAETFANLFAGSELADNIGLLVGSLKPLAKRELHARIRAGDCRLVIGTHALIEDKVVCENVGLVIVDEQHRFGVKQRQKLQTKGGLVPHFLAMTATPIPRTLALTLYGELDISIISVLPAGRKQTVTEVIPFEQRHYLYQKIDEQLTAGRQAFIVCPLISESDTMDVQAAETLYEDIAKKQLKHRRIGLLHGRMKADEKDATMGRFVAGEIDVLVSTTVIEVGVNVPNASVMVIEGTERFGLAQLHQLRGRIGRGEHQGYCYLIPSQGIGQTKRLMAMTSTTDGFKLAEMDLELRGPGAIYGLRQSGQLDLRIAELGDRKSIQAAKNAAEAFIAKAENLVQYPKVAARVRHFRNVSNLN